MRTALAGAVGCLVLAGCASIPRVDYHRLSESRHADSWVLYRLTDTTVVIGAAAKSADRPAAGAAEGDRPGAPISLDESDATCANGACTPGLAAIAAPIDAAGDVFALQPRSRNLVSTAISAAYWPNSLRLKTLSVEVRDHKLEAINAIGALAVGVGKMAATGGARDQAGADADRKVLHLPIVLDLAELKTAQHRLAGNPDWFVKARFLDEPIAKTGFIPRAAAGTVHAAILTSTCRPLEIKILDLKKETIVFRVRVADPDWLTPIPLPAVGAVVMAPLCGGDVQGQKVVEVGVDQLAQAFFSQVEAVRATK